MVAINVKYLREKSVPYSFQEEVATVKERVARGTLDSNKQYHVTSANVAQRCRDVDYSLPRRFVSSAKYRYQ